MLDLIWERLRIRLRIRGQQKGPSGHLGRHKSHFRDQVAPRSGPDSSPNGHQVALRPHAVPCDPFFFFADPGSTFWDCRLFQSVFWKEFPGVPTEISSPAHGGKEILWTSVKWRKQSRGNIQYAEALTSFALQWSLLEKSKTIREMQIKAMVRYHHIPVKMTIIKKSTNNKCRREYREKGTLLYCLWECKLMQPLWRRVQRFL